MKTIIACAVSILVSTGFAQAGAREDCAVSTGAKKGAAFNACLTSKATPKPRTSGYGSGAARRGSCRMSGTC